MTAPRKGTAAALLARLNEMTAVELNGFRTRWGAPSWPNTIGAEGAVRWLRSRGKLRAACRELGV